MIPSEYETIIQMLLNEVIRLRRESDTRFRNALAESSFKSNVTYANLTTGTEPFFFGRKEEKPIDKENKNVFLHGAAAKKKQHEFYGNQEKQKMKDTFIAMTKDKEVVRKIIFDGIEEDVDKAKAILFGKRLYPVMAGLGRFLERFYALESDEKQIEEISEQLYDLFGNQETNHVHIVMQEVFDLFGARVIPEKRWKKYQEGFKK